MKKYPEFQIQQALHSVCYASSVEEARRKFKDNISLLADWRIIYATDEASGPFGFPRQKFSDRGFVSTLLRGESVWILDKESVMSEARVNYVGGGSVFLDSNAASFIRKIAYVESISPEMDSVREDFYRTFSAEDLGRLNSYLYLCEAQKTWDDKTRRRCKETIAAVYALSLDEDPLGQGWPERFRAIHKPDAETFAEAWFEKFTDTLRAGLSEVIEQHAAAAECMILRTKIIQHSSPASPEAKMEELLKFMNDELRIFMLRELIVCADILFHTNKTNLSKKLNSILSQKDPLHTVNNCAWDLFFLRMIDSLSNPKYLPGINFCLDRLITFDEDIIDVMCLTELRAMAIHLGSNRAFPFYNNDLVEWLVDLIGHKRMARFSESLQEDAFNLRADLRSPEKVRMILEQDRQRLLQLATELKV